MDLRDRPGQAGQPAGQTEVVKHRRTQSTDRGPGFLQGQVNQLPCGIELHRCFPWIITDRSRRGVKPVRQGDKTLRDPVVYVAGKASSFDFLSLDNLLDEALVRAFSSDELAMQARLMQCPGN